MTTHVATSTAPGAGLEPGQLAYETRFAGRPVRQWTPWRDLPTGTREVWERVEAACQAPILSERNKAISENDTAFSEMQQHIRTTELSGYLVDRFAHQIAALTAERDEALTWAADWHRVVEVTLTLMDLSPALGGEEAAPAIQAWIAASRAAEAAAIRERDEARARLDAVEDTHAPMSDDGASVWIDGHGLVPLDFSMGAALAAANAQAERLAEALRFYADDEKYRLHGACNPEHSYFTGPDTARAALAEPAAETQETRHDHP